MTTPKLSTSGIPRALHFPALVVLALTLAFHETAAQGTRTSTCRAHDDTAAVFGSYLTTLVTTTEPARVKLRASVGLPAIDSTRVAYVTRTRVCDKLVDAMNARYRTPGLARRLYVYKVGTLYAVQDPAHPIGEYVPTVVFDGRYRYKGSILAP